MRRASWRIFQNLRSRTALRFGSTAGNEWFNQMGTTSKDVTVWMTKNSTNAEIWTQVEYFSDIPRILLIRFKHLNNNYTSFVIGLVKLSSLWSNSGSVTLTEFCMQSSVRKVLTVFRKTVFCFTEFKSIFFSSVFSPSITSLLRTEQGNLPAIMSFSTTTFLFMFEINLSLA